MPPCSQICAAPLSPRKTRSGRKRTNSALSDRSIKASKKRREEVGEQDEDEKGTEKKEERNTGNEGAKHPKSKQQRKTSAARAREDAEASTTPGKMTRTLLLATFIWWIIPGLLVKSGKKWDCTGTLPGLLVFYRGGDLAGNTAKLHQASTGTLPGLSGKVLAIYQDFTVIVRRPCTRTVPGLTRTPSGAPDLPGKVALLEVDNCDLSQSSKRAKMR
ncbi:hypothetical protein JOM56_014513 [Amanita muscaria]